MCSHDKTLVLDLFEDEDLGMYCDAQKVNSLGLSRRSFTCLSRDVMLPPNKGLVRHQLQYGGVLWNAIASRAKVQAVEKVAWWVRLWVPPKILEKILVPLHTLSPTPNLKNWFPPFVSEILQPFLRQI